MIEVSSPRQMIIYRNGWSNEKFLKENQEAWLKTALFDDEWDFCKWIFEVDGKFAEIAVEVLLAHSSQVNTKSIKIRWSDMRTIIKEI